MPIMVNEGGVLHELETVTSNESGVLHELDTVHANEDGVLREIHSAVSFPDTLTWKYSPLNSATTPYTPIISNNGFTVKNTRSNIPCNNVSTDIFEIKGRVKVTLTLTMEIRYGTGSGGLGIYPESGGVNSSSFGISSSGTKSETYLLTAGRYRISGGGGCGNQNGSAANNYTISVSFSK